MKTEDLLKEVLALKTQVRDLIKNHSGDCKEDIRLILREEFKEEEKMQHIIVTKNAIIIAGSVSIMLLLSIIFLILFTTPI